MGFFYPERRIEELLEWQTRSIPGPLGGPSVSITAMRSFWKAFDWIVYFGIDTPQGLSDSAYRNSQYVQGSFGDSLNAIVWHTNKRAKAHLGIDCFAVYPRSSRAV